ncbi:MAG: hypothetical protein IKL82_03890 [Clostridia bacterium]|nr:hypothetical protein [Clostridia bacterium]
MNKIDLLNSRKAEVLAKSADVRKKIAEIVDESSFVELNTFSFASNEFYGEDENGLGVVTGYATVNGYPVYVIAQNPQVCYGGLSVANCQKISACLEKALQNETAVIYLLESQGIQLGEGVAVLESFSNVLRLSMELKGNAPQFAVATGNVLGHASLLFANADYAYLLGASNVSYSSPAVLVASKNGASQEAISGAKSKNGVSTFAVKELAEVKAGILKALDVMPIFSGYVTDCNDDLNKSTPALNAKVDAASLISATFDANTAVELNANRASEVKTLVGRVGGYAVGAIVMDGGEDGVELNLDNVLKINDFVDFASDNGFPVLAFINVKGIKQDADVASSPVLSETLKMLKNLSSLKRINVIYGKAIGFGYTAFASKSFGTDYTFAFANAKISLMDGDAGVMASFGTVSSEEVENLKEKYLESQDAFNSAKIGCVDNVIEPEFVRQYVISALQMIM